MWYSLFRIIIIFILMGICLYNYKRDKKQIKKSVIIIWVILCSISYLIPIENIFYTFNSPQDVFKYQLRGNIYGEINGKNSTMILYNLDNLAHSYTIMPKYKDGWKIGTYFSYKKILQKQYNNKIIVLYKYNEADDYYLIIYDFFANKSEKILEISDNKHSKFEYFSEDSNEEDMITYIYYSYIENYSDDYILTINDNTIKLKE